jgi:hypothetical protein
VKIQAFLLASLVALGSSSALAEPLLRSIFGGAGPPRPPGLIGRVHSDPPMPRSRPAAAPADEPEQKSATASAPANPNVVTIGPSAAAPAAHPAPTGSAPKAPSFPPVQTLE